MSGKFEVSKAKNAEFYFNLKAGNGEIILGSEGYKAMSSCTNGIDSVRKNSQDDKRFVKKTATDGRFYFTLTATNGQDIGRSQMYKTEDGRDNGIASVKKNAPDASVDDQSA